MRFYKFCKEDVLKKILRLVLANLFIFYFRKLRFWCQKTCKSPYYLVFIQKTNKKKSHKELPETPEWCPAALVTITPWKKLFFNYNWQNWLKMDNFQKNLDVLEFSDSYFSNSVKILLVCQVLKVSTALNHISILPVYFLFYKTLLYNIMIYNDFVWKITLNNKWDCWIHLKNEYFNFWLTLQ